MQYNDCMTNFKWQSIKHSVLLHQCFKYENSKFHQQNSPSHHMLNEVAFTNFNSDAKTPT